MGVVKRNGKWTLEKLEDGVYEVKERKETRAKIITDEYTPSAFSDHRQGFLEIIEVKDFSEAKTAFNKFVKSSENSSGLW